MPNNNSRFPRNIRTGVGIATGGVNWRDINVGTGINDTDHLMRGVNPQADPLLLMPLRLEYRFFERGEVFKQVNHEKLHEEFSKAHNTASGSTLGAQTKRGGARRAVISDELKKPLITDNRTSDSSTEQIWFRWYPDENFSEKGVAPITPVEQKILNEVNKNLAGRPWWNVNGDDLDSEIATEQWQSLAGAVGPERAIHLLRGETLNQQDYEDRIGRITILPQRVELFALQGENLISLGRGVDIPNNEKARSAVSYTHEAIEPGGWLNDFDIAINQGMGIKIKDEQTIKSAFSADWIIAVGVYDGQANEELESLLRDRIASGDFEVLDQDSPTNNSSNTRSTLGQESKDINHFLKRASEYEQGLLNQVGEQSAAARISKALGVDSNQINRSIRAGNQDFADAQAMLRVIGPALIDSALDGSTFLDDVDENKFIDELAKHYAARGTLPTLRFGHSAYGVHTVTDVSKIETDMNGTAEERIRHLLANYVTLGRLKLPKHARGVVPVIKPNDEDTADKFLEILKMQRVSSRIDVADVGDDKVTPIGCPYIYGIETKHRPEQYLKDLSKVSLDHLPDPDETDELTPLLYRLARQSLSRNTSLWLLKKTRRHGLLRDFDGLLGAEIDAARKKISKVESYSINDLANRTDIKASTIDADHEAFLVIKKASRTFALALAHLQEIAQKEDGTAQLEMLMLEVFDLLQHRLDAWANGLAWERLMQHRQSGINGLKGGYYGFLGKLRKPHASEPAGGYIQAPSLMQATASAVMRAAYLRNRSQGAFAVNLNSKRSRNALVLLDSLQKGLSLNESLGLRAERWLHDQKLSRLTFPARQQFPLKNQSDQDGEAGLSGRHIIDGLAFIQGNMTVHRTNDRRFYDQLKKKLSDDLDALADLVTAEAVYNRTLGSTEVANAWLQVLSGGSIPGELRFLRTHRRAQASSYRLTQLFSKAEVANSLREEVEPHFAQFCRDALKDFDDVQLHVTLKNSDSAASQSTEVSLSFKFADLGMQAIDAVIGGRSEVQTRVRHLSLDRWMTDVTIADQLGVFVQGGLDKALKGLQFTVDWHTMGEELIKAEKLRNAFQSARIMEPADLNAASPDQKLSEDFEISLINNSCSELRNRVNKVVSKLTQNRNNLTSSRIAYFQKVDDCLSALEDQVGDIELNQRVTDAEISRRSLVAVLRTVSEWAEPAALRLFTLDETLQNSFAVEHPILKLEQRLNEKIVALNAAVVMSNDFKTLSAARACRDALANTLQQTLDGEALPVLPIYQSPPVSIDTGQEPAVALKGWAAQREAVKGAIMVVTELAMEIKAYTTMEALGDEKDEEDPRPENIAPKSHHIGVFLSGNNPKVSSGKELCGLVIDEWSAQRPSEEQVGGLAINYNSPQAQAPNCLLLCVPPNKDQKKWEPINAAEMVRETIYWMQARALSTTDKLTPAAALHSANQLSYKQVDRKKTPRIPKQKFLFQYQPWYVSDGKFHSFSSAVKARSNFINERRGFVAGKNKEE